MLLLYAAGGEKEPATKPSKLLDETSEFVLTYEDKEGDWMLVGDVPWRYVTSDHHIILIVWGRLRKLKTEWQNKKN